MDHLNFHYFKSLSLNYAFFVKCSSSYVIKSAIYCNNEWYICKLLTNYLLKRIWPTGVSEDKYFESCVFSYENTNIVNYRWTIYPCLCLIQEWLACHPNVNMIDIEIISLLDRIWNLLLVRFTHSPTSYLLWLSRLIFSVSINSHPENIYLTAM